MISKRELLKFGMCSYRTYEEWKPGYDMISGESMDLRSYRTYEEWKRQ